MQETSSFHSETNRQPKTKKKTADKKPSILTTFRSLHQNETEKNPKKKHFLAQKLKQNQRKNNFREKEGKTYEKFVASQIHYNAESGERLSEKWSLFSLSLLFWLFSPPPRLWNFGLWKL
jgi:hypothetical protein